MNCTTVGVAAEFENSGVNASYTFNQDGSESLNLNSNVSVCVDGVCFNGGSGFNMNTYTGTSVSRSAGVCFGASSDACAGFELGQGLSWDRSGGFAGMTAYAEVYATFAGVRNSYGYEQGFFGAEGRGAYAGASAFGLHAEVSQNGGRNLSFRGSVYYGSTDEGNDFGADGTHRKVSRLLWIPEFGSLGRFKLGAGVDETKDGLGITQKKKILEMVLDYAEKNGDKESYDLLEILNTSYGDGTHLDDKAYEALQKWLVTKGGLKSVWRPSFPWDPYHKDTYANGKLFDYGNIEFKYWPGTKDVFSSYNYGNNVIDHIFLDMFGYLMSN